MAAKKKTSKAASGGVATATKATAKKKVAKKTAKKKATAKATAKKKATAKTASSKPVAKKAAAKKDDAPKVAAASPTRKVAAKKVTAKKKTARKPAARTAVRRSANTGEFKTFEPYKSVKGEDYMSPEQEDHFRGILLDWKQSLMEEVDRTVGHMKTDATNFPDPNDRATQEEEFSLELRTRDRERKLIKKIEESLTKIDEEEYGYCDGCGVEIGIRRLEARPTANMCIECKTLEEIREKQIA